MKKLIVFVCNGNIHRSVIAEKCLTKILQKKNLDTKFSASSYGLQGTKGTHKPLHKNLIKYPKEYKAAFPTLHKIGIDITDHISQKITPTVVKKAAVIIAMDKKVYSSSKYSLLNQFSKLENKIHIFSELTKNHQEIKDPYGSGSFELHKNIIENIYLTIENKLYTILNWTYR